MEPETTSLQVSVKLARLVKAVSVGDDWALDVLSAPYGGPNKGKDAHGEFFSPNTNFYEDDGAPLPLVAYYHGYTPSGKPQGEPEIIGRAVKQWRDGAGLWHRVILDKTKTLARRVWEAAQAGKARASTGIAGFMGRVAGNGEITHWLIGELSIWDAEGERQPANQYAVARPAVKALLKKAGFFEDDSQDGAEGEKRGQSESHLTDLETQQEYETVEPETNILTPADVAQQITQALEAERAARAAEAEAARQQQEAIDAAIEAERVKWEAENAAQRRLPDNGGAPYVAQFGNLWKYDNLDNGDLGVMIAILNAGKSPVSENSLKALAVRYADGETESDPGVRRVRAAMQHAGMPVKANELNQSTLASYGDDWIGVAYSREMWERINDAATIFPMLPTIEVPQGMESITIPLQSTPPTFYKVAQASAQDTNTLGKVTFTHTSSKMGTSNTSLTVGKLGARAIYTGELQEDSLIDWVSELRSSMELEAGNVLDALVIDGDTATGATTNINDIGGTPGGTESFLVANGFRKLALVTNTANSRSAGALTVEDFLETVKLMGLAGKNAMDKARVAFILDAWTHWKALELTELKSRDVFSAPTIENGNLTGIWGYRVYATPNMHRANQDATYGLKANTSGKVDLDTAANNTTGAILAVRWDQWRLGWKRRIMFETVRVPQADATEVIANMRVGLIYRDTDASAISYGVTL